MSKILIVPSIDIKDGKTVRVVQGIPELGSRDYGNDPVEMAMIWRTENAKVIHVVDFDNSNLQSHKNFDTIADICDSVIIPVELGGGISNLEEADEVFTLGVYRIVVGSLVIKNEREFKKIFEKYGPKKVAAAIDVMDNRVVIKGRSEKTNHTPTEYAKHLSELGVERLIVTDVNRNGMLSGPNIQLCKEIAEVSNGKVTLSGGIGGYKDLKLVTDNTNLGIDSVIIGRALYENRFACQKIWRIAESGIFS